MVRVDFEVFLLLVGSGICTAYWGYQSNGALEWIQPILLLQFLHRAKILDQKPIHRAGLLLLTLLTQTVGYTLAYAGMFNNPSYSVSGVFITFCMSLLFWAILLVVFLTPLSYERRFSNAVSSQALAFPCVWTLVWFVEASFTPIGSTGNPGYSVYNIKHIVLTAALWGMEGILFFMALTASLANQRLLLRQEAGQQCSWIVTAGAPSLCRPLVNDGKQTECDGEHGKVANTGETHKLEIAEGDAPVVEKPQSVQVSQAFVGKVKQHDRVVKFWLSIALLSIFYAVGTRTVAWRGFFLRGIEETFKPPVGVSCILRQPPPPDFSLGRELDSRETLWNLTTERVKAGDAFIVWSEAATVVDGSEGEEELLAEAREILAIQKLPRENGGPMLGLSYTVVTEGMQRGDPASTENVITLMFPNGTVGLRYQKAHLVPFMETSTIAGPGVMTAVDTPFGRVSAAICFDFEFPRLLAQASSLGADLVLQPSWTWGPMANVQLKSDAFRAVESGFTLLRCSSVGVSAVVTGGFEAKDLRESISTSAVTMQAAIGSKVWTVYAHGGYLIGWVIGLIGILYLLMAWLPLAWVSSALNILPGPVNLFFAGVSTSGRVELPQGTLNLETPLLQA